MEAHNTKKYLCESERNELDRNSNSARRFSLSDSLAVTLPALYVQLILLNSFNNN